MLSRPILTVLFPTFALATSGCAATTWDAQVVGASHDAPIALAAPPENGWPSQNDEVEDRDPIILTDARPTLEAYGSWYEDPEYGTLWTPYASEVGADFSPYVTSGHWTYDDEYTWVSDYQWGWLPFHYGRWAYLDTRGWSWIPGRQYSGAWVDWRTGDDGYGYVGWSPMAPSYYWQGGVAVSFDVSVIFRTPSFFCSTGHLFAPVVSAFLVTGNALGSVGGATRPWGGGHRHAPAPSSLGIPKSAVVTIPRGHAGLGRAFAYAHPTVTGSGTGTGQHKRANPSVHVSEASPHLLPARPFGYMRPSSTSASNDAVVRPPSYQLHGQDITVRRAPMNQAAHIPQTVQAPAHPAFLQTATTRPLSNPVFSQRPVERPAQNGYAQASTVHDPPRETHSFQPPASRPSTYQAQTPRTTYQTPAANGTSYRPPSNTANTTVVAQPKSSGYGSPASRVHASSGNSGVRIHR